MYKLLIASQARRELKKIRKLHQEAILNALQDIREDPFVGKPLTKELTRQFSYRVGVFRIVYTINKKDKTVHIITAGHRSTIYQ